jgi:hypothetical protein
VVSYILKFLFSVSVLMSKRKAKALPVTGREGPEGCETSRHPHFLDSRLTYGDEVVSLARQPPFTLRKIPGTHLWWSLSRPQGHIAVGRIRSIEKPSDLFRNRTRDLPVCNTVPQPTTLPRASTSKRRPYDYRTVCYCLL